MLQINKKYASMLVLFLFISVSLLAAPLMKADDAVDLPINTHISDSFHFSMIQLKQSQEYCTPFLSESNSWLLQPGKVKLPTYTKIYEFPVGTKINDVTISYDKETQVSISEPIETVDAFQDINDVKVLTSDISNYNFSCVSDVYPSSYYTIDTGVGLNKENNRVLFLKIVLFPVHYDESQDQLLHVDQFDVGIDYAQNPIETSDLSADETYNLVIITPQTYKTTLNPFVAHKEQYGVSVYVENLDDIYASYQGQDNTEKIKYFIKHAVEEWNTLYVLLIGDMKQLPIRATAAYPWDGYHGNGILTDLYYADIYDSSMNFASWDANQNGIFGEADFNGFPPQPNDDIDDVDLYADVHVGRIPCTTNDELITVLNKIITYETFTYDQIWFKRLVLAGGDTFGLTKGSPPFQYEGEITNVKVGQQLPGFEQTRLWASKRNLHAGSFNRAITKGAGFVSYAGHGFEHGWGTYRPNAIIDSALIIYYTPFLKQIHNEHKLPIIFFDACLTAKLDFNITDLIGYYGIVAPIVNMFLGYTADDFFPPFAWAFLKLESGGCIADIGATRPAYTYVDKDGVYAGAGYLDVHFFKSYHEGVTVGEMLTSAQQDYLNYVGKDFFTVEEYILLGDPSLMVGGYP